MSMKLLFLRLEIALHCAFLAVLLPSGGQSSLVEFYNRENYVDFLSEVDLSQVSASECVNIVDPFFLSVKTETCLMFYSQPYCEINNGKKYPDPDVAQTFKVAKNEPLMGFNYLDSLGARSFHFCNRQAGGSQVDVQIYDETYMQGRMVQEYKNTCGCRNIPLYLNLGKSKDFSIDNNGNGIEVFSQEYCKGEKVEIPAGRNKISLVAPTQHLFDVRSIRPVSGHECIKLKATITKFSFENATRNHQPQHMKLVTSTKVINKGASKITQEYVLSERVVNTLDITVANAYTEIDNVDVSLKFENEASAGFAFFADIKFEFKYGVAYAFQKTYAKFDSNRVVNTTERTVSTRQSVDIPECKECTLSSFLREMVNFPIKYVAYSRVSGTGAGVPLTAAEVRQNLPEGAEYIRDVDENTVEMMAKGDMRANYGIDAFIDVDCQHISGCGGDNGLDANKKSNYQIFVPFH